MGHGLCLECDDSGGLDIPDCHCVVMWDMDSHLQCDDSGDLISHTATVWSCVLVMWDMDSILSVMTVGDLISQTATEWSCGTWTLS